MAFSSLQVRYKYCDLTRFFRDGIIKIIKCYLNTKYYLHRYIGTCAKHLLDAVHLNPVILLCVYATPNSF